jgi:hypothetical protein
MPFNPTLTLVYKYLIKLDKYVMYNIYSNLDQEAV